MKVRFVLPFLLCALAAAQVYSPPSTAPGAWQIPRADATGYVSWSWLNPATPVFSNLIIDGVGAGCGNLFGTDHSTYASICATLPGTSLVVAGVTFPVNLPSADGYVLSSDSSGQLRWDSNAVRYAVSTVSLAQINAGQTIIPGVSGRTLRVLGVQLNVTGTFTTCTDVRVSDTSGGPVDIGTVAVASLAGGNKLNEVSAGFTAGAGWLAALTADSGIQVRKTGSNCAGGTAITFRTFYAIN